MRLTESKLRQIIRKVLKEDYKHLDDEQFGMEDVIGWLRDLDNRIDKLDNRLDMIEPQGYDY